VTTNRTFAASDQVLSARRAAATTSAGAASMLAGGALSELESAIWMVVVGHLICTLALWFVY
jgi:hypothetical protein